jgi:hypothetical protein
MRWRILPIARPIAELAGIQCLTQTIYYPKQSEREPLNQRQSFNNQPCKYQSSFLEEVATE